MAFRKRASILKILVHDPNSTMNHSRKPFDRLFDSFNGSFAKAAEQGGLIFERRSGPNIGRAIRLKGDRLERGVFLELKGHWMKSDPVDPQVQFAYAARFRPKPVGFPVYFLSKVFYEGRLSGLCTSIEEKLKLAMSEVKMVLEELVVREGRHFEDWPREE